VASADGNTAPAGAPAARQEPQDAASVRELAQATRDISEYIQTVSRNLDIAVDDELGRTVITVLDAKTDEVVRQIPSEEIMAIARFLRAQQAESAASDPVRGLLVNKET
jgi:flagellar protein FlaG